MADTFAGAIFDVDGVLVDSPHEAAWREGLRQLMEGEWAGLRDRTTWTPEAFTAEVYQRVLSGKPRLSGARDALEYFKVPDVTHRAITYAEHKQRLLIELIDHRQFTAYPDALRFILAVRALLIPLAAASSSKNAGRFLRKIRLDVFVEESGLRYDFVHPQMTLLDIFDADLSGRDLVRGKPDPEIFLAAAVELGAPPQQTVVIEDAVSGVQAAKAGGMAALGVARHDDRDLLAGANADLVVASLDEVDIDGLSEQRLRRRT